MGNNRTFAFQGHFCGAGRISVRAASLAAAKKKLRHSSHIRCKTPVRLTGPFRIDEYLSKEITAHGITEHQSTGYQNQGSE